MTVSTGPIASYDLGSLTNLRSDTSYTVTVQVKDEFNNLITTTDHTTTVLFTRTDAGASYQVTAPAISTVSGVSTHRFVLYRSGNYTPSVTVVDAAGTTRIDARQSGSILVQSSVCGANDASKPYRCLDGSCVAAHTSCSGITFVF